MNVRRYIVHVLLVFFS